MWISSSPSKNRSDRGRIDVFFRGLNWIFKASLLILALASLSVASDSVLPEWCDNNPDTCFAKNSNELEGAPRDDIGFGDGEISWSASEKSEIELYKVKNKECELSFNMPKPTFPEPDKDCKFSLFNGCKMDIVLKEVGKGVLFSFSGGDGEASVFSDSSVNVGLVGGNLTCTPGCRPVDETFCDFKPQEGGGWCKFNLALTKTGKCDGTIRFDSQDYKLLVRQPPTTVAPETSPTTDATTSVSIASVPNNANTTPVAEASSLAPWIIALIVVIPLLLVLGGIGFLVFWFCFRKRRGTAQNMAEKGKAGSDYQCETIVPTAKSTQNADRPYQSESAPSSVHSKKDRKEEERSKRTSQNEVTKTVSQKKQNVPEPAPSPSPLPENKPNRILAPDELYEPLGDPDKAVPMHLSEKKISEKKPGRIKFTDYGYAKTTPDGEAAGLSPWIIAGIVVAVLLLLGIGVGLLVYFLICRRKRRGSPQNMAEKGNAGSVCLTEMTCPTQTIATQGEASHMKSGSEMVGEPSANERKEVEERSKPASKVEVAKPVSQKKKKDNTYQSLQKEEPKNVPAPSPSPAQENKPKRTLAPDELYEPLGDPDKAIPMHLSEKKISEKKKKKEDPYQRLDLLQKEGAKNAPATPSPSRSSKKKKSEKKKKDDHYHRLESLENEGKK
ncbi:hypothetical protein DdX_15855 [Ditylenchus destructor]|uniref:Uncharacterized protein n=1 Tax=Ditylenchus destructor TaxID=166010 RepID=A0AAD4R0J1_9BILA|nr:hypothetical protein DdX_15855 [Ditylenchus destructor]